MRFQPIYDIAALCAKKGISKAVLCPGSRCAPLTLAFTRHPGIQSYTFSDERSAGFIALGMAQESREPVVVVCTSGTAVYNLAPAVAEAYFSQTPMVIISADRPMEWIAQQDGQTIFQSEIFGGHVKKYFQLPQEYEHPDDVWAINRMVNDAINLSRQDSRGPVHINAPFREPLYPEKEETIFYNKEARVIEDIQNGYALSETQKDKIIQNWGNWHRVLIVAGQQPPDNTLAESLQKFFLHHDVPMVCDIISNCHGIEKSIRHADLFLGQAPGALKETLRPDLLITIGQSLVSKNLKTFLRAYTPEAHWHIQCEGPAADTFRNMTEVFRTTPAAFFGFLSTLSKPGSFENQEQQSYDKLWEEEDLKTQHIIDRLADDEPVSELEVVKEMIRQLPAESNLHLANSMSVRYANFFGLAASQKRIRVFSNRGTSGIDGCTSTSIGHYLSSSKPTFLITGDVAFFYDRNAFWHHYNIAGLRILLLNNHGGLIFNIIDGPASLPEAQEYFITRQKLNAEKLCEEFGIAYLAPDNRKKLKNAIKDFFEFDGTAKILELETDVTINKKAFENLKHKIKKSYEL